MERHNAVRELSNVTGVRIYKVIAGGSESSLRDYNEQTRRGDSLSQAPGTDWSALYTQFKSDHALGTVPYRWERDENCREAVLVQATICTPLHIVVLDDPTLHNSSLSGKAKADLVKEQLGIRSDRALMEALGDTRRAALIRETADEWELIFPHNLFARIDVKERIVAHFRRHSTLPVTSRWCAGDDGIWKAWEERSQVVGEISDLSMDWLCNGTDNL